MARAEKAAVVEKLTDRLKRAQAVVVTDYRGMSVAQLTDLRRRLRQGGVEFQVAKNTLTRRAAAAAGLEILQPVLAGPVGLAFTYDDPATAARLVQAYARENRAFNVTGGLLGQSLLSAADVRTLAELPDRPYLLSSTLASLNAPLSQFLATSEGLLRECLSLLTARHDQLAA